jgi:hypothetical protein
MQKCNMQKCNMQKCIQIQNMNDTQEDYEINNKWLKEIKDTEKDYNDFYKEKPTSIKIYYLYVNKDNEVNFCKTETHLLDTTNVKNATLNKDTLIAIIKKNSFSNNINYKLLSLLKFNLDIDPEDVISLAIHKMDGSEYLSSESVLRDIVFNDTVCIFQDINSLFLVYYEKVQPQPQKTQTRKIYLNTITNTNTNTKKNKHTRKHIQHKFQTKKLQILVD